MISAKGADQLEAAPSAPSVPPSAADRIGALLDSGRQRERSQGKLLTASQKYSEGPFMEVGRYARRTGLAAGTLKRIAFETGWLQVRAILDELLDGPDGRI